MPTRPFEVLIREADRLQRKMNYFNLNHDELVDVVRDLTTVVAALTVALRNASGAPPS